MYKRNLPITSRLTIECVESLEKGIRYGESNPELPRPSIKVERPYVNLNFYDMRGGNVNRYTISELFFPAL